MRQYNYFKYFSFIIIAIIGIQIVTAVVYHVAKTIPNMTYLDCNSSSISPTGYAILNSINGIGSHNSSMNQTIEIIYRTVINPTLYNTVVSKGNTEGSAPWNTNEWFLEFSPINQNYFFRAMNYNKSSILHSQNVINNSLYQHVILTTKVNSDNNTAYLEQQVNGALSGQNYLNGLNFTRDLNYSIYFCDARNWLSDPRFKFNGTIESIKIYNNFETPNAIYDRYMESSIMDDSNNHMVVLMLHNIKDNTGNNDGNLRADFFDSVVNFFNNSGYKSITLNQYYSWKYNNSFSMPKNSVVFIFDDDKYGTILNAKPILDKYGFIGVSAVITNYTDNALPIISSDTMSWTNLSTLSNAGWEIASHSVNHDYSDWNGSGSNQTRRYYEYNYSYFRIGQMIGVYPNSFIYPGNKENIGNRTECLQFYTGCSGDTVYMTADDKIPKYIYKNTNMDAKGLTRYEINNYTTLDILSHSFNESLNYSLILNFDNSTGTVFDSSPMNNSNISFYNVSVKTDGATKIKLYTSNLNATLPYLNNNLPSTISSLDTAYDDTSKLVNLSCTGFGSITINNLNLIKGSSGYYEHLVDGVHEGYYNTDNFTINSCSEHDFLPYDGTPVVPNIAPISSGSSGGVIYTKPVVENKSVIEDKPIEVTPKVDNISINQTCYMYYKLSKCDYALRIESSSDYCYTRAQAQAMIDNATRACNITVNLPISTNPVSIPKHNYASIIIIGVLLLIILLFVIIRRKAKHFKKKRIY